MLPKTNRLTRLDVETLKKQGHKLNSNSFLFLYLVGDDNTSKFGVLVSKKISKNAVYRNTLKRKIMRALAEGLSQSGGVRCLFIMHRDSVSRSQDELDKEVRAALVKITEK